tara:strand:- start:1659 stop:2261 length:603 start_codon:yes stop_codon:yes gene_type:complete
LGIIIGLTGGMASGKSLIANYFGNLRCKIIDCDKLSKDITSQGGAGIASILESFDRSVIGKDGSLDRRRMAEIVFSNKEKLKKLESILHPIIEKKVFQIAKTYWNTSPNSIVIVDAVVLFESGLYKKLNKNIAVICKRDIRIKRAMERDSNSRASIELRMKNQSTDEEKSTLADYVIVNEGTKEEALNQAKKVYKDLLII